MFSGKVFSFMSVAVALAAFVLLSLGVEKLTFSSDSRVFFPEESEHIQNLDQFERTFGKHETSVIVVETSQPVSHNPLLLERLRRITHDAWKMEAVVRVESIANFQYVYASEEGLEISDLIGPPVDLNELGGGDETVLATRLSDVDEIFGQLISPDEMAVAVIITYGLSADDASRIPNLVNQARGLAQRHLGGLDQIEVHYSGSLVTSAAFFEASQRDAVILWPIALGLIFLLAGIMLRSLIATIVVAFTSLCIVVSSLGFAGHIGMSLDAVTTSAPIVLITLAVANIVHLIHTYQNLRLSGLSAMDARNAAFSENIEPILVANVTSAAGFYSLILVDVPPLSNFGFLVGSGILIGLALSLVAMANTLHFVSPGGKRRDLEAPLQRVAMFAARHSIMVIGGGVFVATLILAIGIPRLNLDEVYYQYFSVSNEYRKDAEAIESSILGLNTLELEIVTLDGKEISDPEYLSDLDALCLWLEQQDGVRHVSCLSKLIKRLNQKLHENDPEYFRIPASRELSGQLLLLYEMSLPLGLDLSNTISIDRTSTRATVSIAGASAQSLSRLSDEIYGWTKDNLVSVRPVLPTGQSLIFAMVANENIPNLILSMVLSVAAITFILLIWLRDRRLILLAIFANVIPIVIVLGVWGVAIGTLTFAAAGVLPVALGIVVDDTVHLLYRFSKQSKVSALAELPTHIGEVVRQVGYPIFVTTVCLTVGFWTLSLSEFHVTWSMGVMSASIVTAALAADIILVPALYAQLHSKG